jgi:Bacterial Ig-like domain (group 3)
MTSDKAPETFLSDRLTRVRAHAPCSMAQGGRLEDVRTRGRTTPGHRPRWVVLALALALCGLALAPRVAAAASFTWSGAAPAGTPNWSNATNWGGTAPSGTVETLAFPALTSPACTAKPPTATCYQSNNDVSGLEVNALSIDDGVPYNITGNAITLGSGGITAAPSASDVGSVTRVAIHVPITLSAPQTWSITGGSLNQQLGIEAPVTGGNSDTLAINFSHGTFLGLDADTEVGAVTATGHGTIALGRSTTTASLNATDGNAVSFSGGAGLFTGTAKIGPLTMNEGTIQIGQGSDGSSPDGSLTVAGGVTLASAGTLFTFIDHSGTAPATDYTQLSATGPVNLASANLRIQDGFAIVGGKAACAQLTPGDVDTLLTTTGVLTGTFSNAPNGATMSLECYLGATGTTTPPTVKINYTPNTVTATVVTSGSSGATSTTALVASPASPLTNQTVTLTATVTASSGTLSGTVSFKNHGTPIAGCESQPVTLSGPPFTAICQTSFTAASSPEALTAVFTPASGSGLAGSTSSTDNLTVGLDTSATALGVSNASPGVGASVTYTATVTPGHAGLTEPSGSVEFLDGGTPIGSCSSQPLTQGGSSSSATCTLSYPAAGLHSITATYLADLNFTGSSFSPAQTVTVQAPPPPAPPTNTSLPTISGTAQQGQTLTESHGEWSNSPTSYGYQWEDCDSSGNNCSAIAGANSQTYTLIASDVVHTIRVQESATNAGGTGGPASSAPTGVVQAPPSPAPSPVLAQRETVGVVSGTATVRLPGTTTFVPLSGSTAIPDGSEVDATNGHVLITVATPNGQTASAEVYGGRFVVHQDATGETHFILTLPLTGCPRMALPHGSAAAIAASAKHGSGPKSRHLWVSEHGGSWGTNGRYVSTSVEGTTWLTLDECTRSEVKVTAGKVKVHDLVRKRTRTVSAGRQYVAVARSSRRRRG